MRKQQGTVNNGSDIKQTLVHVVHEASICRIWGGHHNKIEMEKMLVVDSLWKRLPDHLEAQLLWKNERA